MAAYLSLDGLRAVLVLSLALLQVVIAYWPEWRKWPHTIASRSERLRNPLVPIDWAFAIWGVIFLGCAAFAVWQLMPAQLTDPLAQRIGWLAIAAFGANVAWQIYVPRRDLDAVSVAIIAVEFAVLMAIVFTLHHAGGETPRLMTGATFWLVAAPFQLLAGWVTAAVFVNGASAMQRAGVQVGGRIAAGMLVVAGALGVVVAGMTGSGVYAAAVCWALFGLVVANVRRADGRRSVAWLAALTISAVIVAAR